MGKYLKNAAIRIDSLPKSRDNTRMQSRRPFILQSLAVLLLIASALPCLYGCAGTATGKNLAAAPTKVYSATGRALSYKEILLIVNAQSQQFDTMKADVRIELKSDVLKDIQYCNAKLVLSRPDKIRLKGFQAFIPTLFDIASNGKQYWLYFPQDKKVYTGDYYHNDVYRPSPMDIDPSQLCQAFLVDGITDGQEGQVIFVEREGENQYVLSQLDGWQNRYYLKRKIWIDGGQKRVTRQQYFVNDGNLSFEVQYDKYLTDKRIALPQQILFFRPDGSSRAIMELVNYEFNQSFNPNLFELSDIRGAETVVLK